MSIIFRAHKLLNKSVTDYRLQITDYRLQITDYSRLQITKFFATFDTNTKEWRRQLFHYIQIIKLELKSFFDFVWMHIMSKAFKSRNSCIVYIDVNPLNLIDIPHKDKDKDLNLKIPPIVLWRDNSNKEILSIHP